MLRVVYEATRSLGPGRVAEVRESRGLIRVRVDQDAPAEQFTEALTAALKVFLANCGWFQIWRGRIISADSPESPLTVEYEVDDKIDRLRCIEVRESCGLVKVHVSSSATTKEFVRALNPATERFLAGGQWFQLWHGEIITMDSPDSRAA
ncbi:MULTISPECIES: hypothetical protein [Streptomyces]|uniref:Uncharacterized protein n=1 Tax=Streptomyces dengpaensis TaxID=2049881 RepID=A0ABM6SYX1_9ACTN|nr:MULTISPECIES: hypothetical protein [Streptomyces]AVH59908.1 hypothetical protein C4B68_33705 [Streptomyces dengpaensis]PIB09544.1 hypothetical protein B1C81_10380 [Streptomyces sp. HG99]